jgi:hypothetical protein
VAAGLGTEQALTKDLPLSRSYNTTMDKIWDNINRGVSFASHQGRKHWSQTDRPLQRQWKDIKHKYVTASEDTDGDDE